jgi:hypothetical protein
MGDVFLMCGGQCVAYLSGYAQRLAGRNGPLPNAFLQGRAFHQLHNEVIRTNVVDLTDVRVIESCDSPGLTLETLVKPLQGSLDRDVTLQPSVVRAINFAHATLADERLNAIGAESRTDNGLTGVRAGGPFLQQRFNLPAQVRIGSANDGQKCIAFGRRTLTGCVNNTLDAPPAFRVDCLLGGRARNYSEQRGRP